MRGRSSWKLRLIIALGVIVTLAVFGGGLYILWVVLNSYIAPEKPSERKDLIQAFAVIAGGIIALVTLLIGWLNLRHNQRALSVQQSNTEATLRQQRLIEEERAQDAALQAYLERMGELLLLGQEKEAEALYAQYPARMQLAHIRSPTNQPSSSSSSMTSERNRLST